MKIHISWLLLVRLIQHAAASMTLTPSIWIKTILSKMYKTSTVMYMFFLYHHFRGRCFLECFLQRQRRITCLVVPSCNLSPNFYSCMLSFFLAGKTRELCRETQFQQKGKILSKLVPVATFLILQTKDDSFVFAGVFTGGQE